MLDWTDEQKMLRDALREFVLGRAPVEQLARDAKALQIYAGTDELQITHIARGLLRPSQPAVV